MAIPINERLKAVRTALKLSQRDFTKGIYTAQSVYARMESGKQPVNERTIELVCYKYGVERAYLREGKTDKIFSDIPPDVKLDHLYQIFIELNGLFQDYLIIQAKELFKVQNQYEEQHQKPAPKSKKRQIKERKNS
ncbi:helix-turn-helix domain-containing protein [Treponema sp. R80B11-R83G3]